MKHATKWEDIYFRKFKYNRIYLNIGDFNFKCLKSFFFYLLLSIPFVLLYVKKKSKIIAQEKHIIKYYTQPDYMKKYLNITKQLI